MFRCFRHFYGFLISIQDVETNVLTFNCYSFQCFISYREEKYMIKKIDNDFFFFKISLYYM